MTYKPTQPRTKVSSYFGLAFGWSFVFWFLTIILGGINQFPGSILQFIGGAGPLIAALVIIHIFEPVPIRRDFWSRTFDLRRIPRCWSLVAILIHPAILFVAFVLNFALGEEHQLQTNDLTNPMAIISLVIFVFVFGPLPEEMGWRGVGYDRLERQMNPVMASLLLGIAWAAWHIPLFLIEGTFQNQLGFGSFRFWIFLASNVPLTVIITWVYNHTDRSILAAVFVHFSGNIIGAILAKSNQIALLELILLTLVANVLIARTGMSLGKQRQPDGIPPGNKLSSNG